MAVDPTSRSPRVPSSGAATSGGDGVRPHVLHASDGFVMATWKNVAIHVWTLQSTVSLVDTLDALTGPFTSLHPEGVSAVHIITKNAPLPSAEVREQLQRVMKRYLEHVACICHVVEGSGFWASALHGFLTGLHWIARGTFRLHICADIASAARWVPAPHVDATKVAISAAELEQALRFVRGRADELPT